MSYYYLDLIACSFKDYYPDNKPPKFPADNFLEIVKNSPPYKIFKRPLADEGSGEGQLDIRSRYLRSLDILFLIYVLNKAHDKPRLQASDFIALSSEKERNLKFLDAIQTAGKDRYYFAMKAEDIARDMGIPWSIQFNESLSEILSDLNSILIFIDRPNIKGWHSISERMMRGFRCDYIEGKENEMLVEFSVNTAFAHAVIGLDSGILAEKITKLQDECARALYMILCNTLQPKSSKVFTYEDLRNLLFEPLRDSTRGLRKPSSIAQAIRKDKILKARQFRIAIQAALHIPRLRDWKATPVKGGIEIYRPANPRKSRKAG